MYKEFFLKMKKEEKKSVKRCCKSSSNVNEDVVENRLEYIRMNFLIDFINKKSEILSRKL